MVVLGLTEGPVEIGLQFIVCPLLFVVSFIINIIDRGFKNVLSRFNFLLGGRNSIDSSTLRAKVVLGGYLFQFGGIFHKSLHIVTSQRFAHDMTEVASRPDEFYGDNASSESVLARLGFDIDDDGDLHERRSIPFWLRTNARISCRASPFQPRYLRLWRWYRPPEECRSRCPLRSCLR